MIIEVLTKRGGKTGLAVLGDEPVTSDWLRELIAETSRITGKVYHLTVESNEPLSKANDYDTERSFALACGLFAHNIKP
jgi:hypothetical protein